MDDNVARAWYAPTQAPMTCAVIDICGITAKNGGLNSINIPSYSPHYWFTIGY